MPSSENESIVSELRSIKMLLVLQLLNQGFKQRQLAAVLGVSEATMSRMISRDKPQAKKPGGHMGDDVGN